MTLLLSLSCFPVPTGIIWMVLWCLLSPLFFPLNPQLVEADAHPSWVWFCQRFLLVKREFFFSPQSPCARSRWVIRWNLLVSLTRQFFKKWLCINWTNLEFIEFELIWLWLCYNEMGCITEVPWYDISCDLVLQKQNWNWIVTGLSGSNKGNSLIF